MIIILILIIIIIINLIYKLQVFRGYIKFEPTLTHIPPVHYNIVFFLYFFKDLEEIRPLGSCLSRIKRQKKETKVVFFSSVEV